MVSSLLLPIVGLVTLFAGARAVSVADVFPTATSTNLEVMCQSGFSIGGGASDQLQATAWNDMGPCRIHCHCVAKDGSCKYCCKKTASTCERHLPLYKYAAGSCLTCNANQWLHEAGVSGDIGTSSYDNSAQWVARGSDYSQTLVANSAGTRFIYYSGFVACWGTDGNGNSASSAPDCNTFGATETTSTLAPVGKDPDYVTPYLSSVLNQGGCGNCYIQAAVAAVTDRALRKMDASQRSDWTSKARSYSTGHTGRCHYDTGAGDSCDGGDFGHVFTQLTGQAVSSTKPALKNGASTCMGGVYGGPGTSTAHASDSVDYYSKWAYGCNSGCSPFHAGFAGPVVPAGAACPAGYTDNAATMRAGFQLNSSGGFTANHGSNLKQYSNACGCGGTLKAAGSCSKCCVFHSGGALWPFSGLSPYQCSYTELSKLYVIGAEADFASSFEMTGDDIMNWNVPMHKKIYALEQCGCSTPTVDFGQTKQCTSCCIPRPYNIPGYQYNPKKKEAQPPKQCSGAGVTAGSTPGAATCTIGSCTGSCDSSSDTYANPHVVFDDSANSVYSPIGMISGDTGYNDWNPMNEWFIKDEIVQHGPVAVGFMVTHGFQKFFTDSPTAIMSVTDSQTLRNHGGHAVSIVGWGLDQNNNNKKYWLVRNSWGRSFADSGFFRMEIGGGVSKRLGFATNQHGVDAMSPVLKTGAFRRLHNSSAMARKLAQTTVNKGNKSPKAHGGSITCSDHHKPEVDEMRVWFLADKANYKGVSSNCAVPWEYDSMNGCSAQIIQGLHIKTTFHVKDCNGTLYHMTVRLAHDGSNVSNTKIIGNTGPDTVASPPANPTSATPRKTASVSMAAKSGFMMAEFVIALFAALCFL